MIERPENFVLKHDHSLAKGLVFAGLGRAPGSTRYIESSEYGNHGILNSMDPPSDWLWIPELGRWALEYSGSNQSVIFPLLNIGNTCTILVWANFIAGSNKYLFYSDDNYIIFRTGTTNRLATWEGVYWDNLINSGIWQHWSFVLVNGVSTILYRNGIRISSKILTSATCSLFQISRNNLAGWVGDISDVVIHNRVLSEAEIQQLADPSNVMLSGLLQSPKRKYYAIQQTKYSKHYFMLRSSIGKSLLRLSS